MGESPHRPRQLQLCQIKMGFRSFHSLFTRLSECCRPPAHSTFSLFMTHLIVSTSRPCVFVCVCNHETNIPGCLYTWRRVCVCASAVGLAVMSVTLPLSPQSSRYVCFQRVSAKFFHNKVEQQKEKKPAFAPDYLLQIKETG